MGTHHQGQHQRHDRQRHRCDYQAGAEQCRLMGTTSDTIRAESETRWYCGPHAALLEGRISEAKCAQQLRERLATPEADWRDALVDEVLASGGRDVPRSTRVRTAPLPYSKQRTYAEMTSREPGEDDE